MTHALITGGAGFIGSHLSEKLLSLGRRQAIVRPLGDQPLGLGQHRAGVAELAGCAGPPGEHLRQRLGRRLQHRQQIAR